MIFFELEANDISVLSDGDLRELVARLCEAELIQQGLQPSTVTWGGAQEAADGGLDVSVKGAGQLPNPNFVPRENTGFQVKKHTMGKSACKKEMQENGKPKPVIADLATRKGAYIIVSGKDDCSDKMLSDRVDGMNDAVSSLQNKNDILLDFYGRDRLSVWLRQHPGVALWVRSRLGKPLSGWKPFGRWAATPPQQEDEFLVDEHPCVIDANSHSKEPAPIPEGIKLTRDRLRKSGSTVRITGLSGVGKTRFAQALFETDVGEDALPASNVIYADLGDDITPTASELASYLIANDFAAYLVLDNCPPDVHRRLQKQVSINSAKLRLLTIEYDISDDLPEETEVIHLEPSSEETVSKLVQKRFPELGRVNADKVAEFSGGNARIAIALAGRVTADETLSNFSDEELFQRLFSQRKGATDDLLESAEILSLVYSFNVSRSEFNDELSVLGAIAGADRRILYRNHAELLRRQLAQQRGDWRAVLPHALANRLAKRALQNISSAEINAELFKSENLRLFKSCAHRMGYLHDFEPARQLANSWIQPGGPLHDITSCTAELLAVLDYIAPVFPETVLNSIETAANDVGFASRNNEHFYVFVRLLCQLAYEDESFDRAATILLKFAETEKRGETHNSIVGEMKNLFSLYLSGTQAVPVRRQAFVKGLIDSNNSRRREIASELLHLAFETSHWTSISTFGFGARRRDSGWQPKTYGEKLDWYVGFIRVLQPVLKSDDKEAEIWAKALLADHFRGLWTSAGCFDVLEEIVCDYAYGGKWPEMWISIKQTLHFDGGEHAPELLARLQALEKLAAPSNLYSEIEAYALVNTWNHAEIKGGNYTEKIEEIRENIIRLGELAASEPDYLERLGAKLWEKHIDALWSFGKGLAKGTVDQAATFEFLVGSLQKQQLDLIYPVLLVGYINAVHDTDPSLVRTIQERVLEIPELKPHFVYLLGANTIEPWGAKKLLEVARSGELEAWRFEQIGNGRMHETISDSDLAEILTALNALEGGVFSTLQILRMRFWVDNYTPSDGLRTVGRKTIRGLLSIHRKVINTNRLQGIDRVVEECLSASAPDNEIAEIVALLCEGVETYRLYSSELGDIITALIKNFLELLLDSVFTGDENEELLAHRLFKDRIGRNESSLNNAPVDRLLNWCNGDQDRIAKVVKVVPIYSGLEAGACPFDNPKHVILSAHVKALLDAANDKLSVIETIFLRTRPSSWSDSLAEILEVRSKAFSELLEHPTPEVREFAKTKLGLIEQSVRINREREAEENSRREQRFE